MSKHRKQNQNIPSINVIPLLELTGQPYPAISSQGDLIVTYANSNDNLPRFYGIKKDGRPFFDNGNSLTKIYGPETINYATTISKFVINSVDNKEYLLVITNWNGKTSLHSLESEFSMYSVKETESVLFTTKAGSKSIMKLSDSYLYGTLVGGDGLTCYLRLFKFSVSFTSSLDTSSFQKSKYEEAIGCFHEMELLSFYETAKGFILCSFFTAAEFKILVLKPDFNKKAIIEIDKFITNADFYTLFQIIHLFGEVGAFVYYPGKDSISPRLQIRELNSEGDSLENYIPQITNSYIEINQNQKFNLFYYGRCNELIKINNNSFILAVAGDRDGNNRNAITIIIFDLYNNYQSLQIKTYNIALFKDYYYYFTYNAYTNFILYNDYVIVFGSFSSHNIMMMLFLNYCNSTDLINTDDIYENYLFDPKSQITIENNFLGYILTSIKIISVPNFIKFKSSISNTEIVNNTIISADEQIKFDSLITKAKRGEKFFIEFFGIATEPEESIYKEKFYVEPFGKDTSEFYYERKYYMGRTARTEFTCNSFCYCPDFCVVSKYLFKN